MRGRSTDLVAAGAVEPSVESGKLQLARLQQLSDEGYLVRLMSAADSGDELLVSNSLCELAQTDEGALLVVGVLAGIGNEKVILGRLCESDPLPGSASVSVAAIVDDDHAVVRGKESVVLECGKASITLTAAGKVIIKGDYVVSDSKGVNRLRGGSVQIN